MNEDDRARAEDCGADDGQANTSFQTVRRPACAYAASSSRHQNLGFHHVTIAQNELKVPRLKVIVVKCLLQGHLKKCIRSPHNISPAASNLPRI